MSRDWQPGDVALVECSDGKERRAICGRRALDYGLAWVFRDGSRRDVEESSARPLVVIDPRDNPEGLPYLVPQHFRNYAVTLRKHHGPVSAQMMEWLADHLQDFTPKPPKPEEPTGLGAVVKDADGELWLRWEIVGRHPKPWTVAGSIKPNRAYLDITAVKVLREGVTE